MSEPAKNGHANGNGTKSILGLVIVVVTVIGALGSAIVHFNGSTMQTMKAYIAVQDERMKGLEHRLLGVEHHANKDDHPGAVIAMINEMKKDVEFLTEALEKHVDVEGHPELREKTARLEERIRFLEKLLDEVRGKP